MDNNLTIIPARAGSKRVPGKNIKPLEGKPLIAWSIDAAKNTKQLKNICVATENQEIADIALLYGADIPGLRTVESATDDAPTRDAISETIAMYEQHTGKHIAWVTLLQPTSPFRKSATINLAIDSFIKSSGKTLVSVCKHGIPLHWLNTIDSKGYIQNANVSSREKHLYHYNGAIYIFSRETFDTYGDIYSPDIIPFIMDDHIESLDIDTYEDWQLASLIAYNFSAMD